MSKPGFDTVWPNHKACVPNLCICRNNLQIISPFILIFKGRGGFWDQSVLQNKSCLFYDLTCFRAQCHRLLRMPWCQLETQNIKQANQKLFMKGSSDIFSMSNCIVFWNCQPPPGWWPQAQTPLQESTPSYGQPDCTCCRSKLLASNLFISQNTFLLPKRCPELFHALIYLGVI